MLFPPLSIHDTQAQALAQQFAELSRLAQPPFCLSQHLFRDGLPDPTLSWLKGRLKVRLKGWLKSGLKSQKTVNQNQEKSQAEGSEGFRTQTLQPVSF